jgi:hypothetical protein
MRRNKILVIFSQDGSIFGKAAMHSSKALRRGCHQLLHLLINLKSHDYITTLPAFEPHSWIKSNLSCPIMLGGVSHSA